MVVLVGLFLACTVQRDTEAEETAPQASPATSEARSNPAASVPSPAAPDPEAGFPAPKPIRLEDAREILFGALPRPRALSRCKEAGEDPGDQRQIRCLIEARYEHDVEAAKIAVALYERMGTIAGLLVEQDFDGGYRGKLHLVPHLPEGEDRKHLAFVAGALYELDDFVAGVEKRAGAKPRYQLRHLAFRFYRSVKAKTPAAFVDGWSVAYNVRGTLNYSQRVVRDLLFHEIFHLNDFVAGQWSTRVLGEVHRSIVTKCGRDADCLEPFARHWLKVRGGTYYAFMPGNGVEEYAAELAVDYLREQLTMQSGKRVGEPFKCVAPQNGKAWRVLVDGFFAGTDLVPECPVPRLSRPAVGGPR